MTHLDTSSSEGRSFSPKGGETETRVGPLGLNAQGFPDQAAIDRLYAERDFQRACQAYLWALPLVAYGNGRTSTRRCSARATATSSNTCRFATSWA